MKPYSFMLGAPERIRTSNRSVRSRILYPVELRAHIIHTLLLYIVCKKNQVAISDKYLKLLFLYTIIY